MLSDQTDLGIVLSRICRIAVLKGVSVGMVDIDVTIWYIMREERPEEVACNYWISHTLAIFDDAVE